VRPSDVAKLGAIVLDEVEKAIVGKRPVLERVMLAILCDGHVLIEDYPGLAKTLLAKSFAAALGLEFRPPSRRHHGDVCVRSQSQRVRPPPRSRVH